jgi:hypothetical protein
MLRRLSVPLLILALLGVNATPASAYDGTDPNSTGCAASASTVYFITIDQGTTQLRFSSSCQTAWARFVCAQPGAGCTEYQIQIYRNTDGYSQVNGVSYPFYTAPNEQLYTNQLNDGSGVSAKACYRAAATNWIFQCTSSYFFE